MSNRQIANKLAESIKDTYSLDKCVVCWSFSQAKKYGLLKWTPNTVAFACVYGMGNGEDVTAVVPIAKRVLFQEIDGEPVDNTAVLLAVVGKFLINHFELLKQAEITRVVSGALIND